MSCSAGTGIARRRVAQARQVARLRPLHEFLGQDLIDALELYVAHTALDMRDAVYAATARDRDLEYFVSTGRAFRGIPGLVWADPADQEMVAELAA